MRDAVVAGKLPKNCCVQQGTIDEVADEQSFDAVLYIDVLEHIETDGLEVTKASRRLVPGGYLVVLAPAHQVLFSPFDAAIGHYRRYSRATLRVLGGHSDHRLVKLHYLDSVGLAASAGNRFLLKSGMPNRKQIRLWDRFMVPLSSVIDPLLGYKVGKSILGVWQRR